MSDRDYNPLIKEEVVSPMEPDSQEFAEMQFLFNTLFNESSGHVKSNDINIYEIEKAYSLKNQYISLNFEKRQMNEVSSYGWYESDNFFEDKNFDEQIIKYRYKGFEKIKDEIKICAPSNKESDRFIIIICKFIVGKSEIIFQDQKLSDEDREKYKVNYDTIVRIMNKSDNKQNEKNYSILKKENIELLYLIKAKKGEFQSQLIECSKLDCPNNELINEPNKRELSGDKKMYYCLLKEDYLCETCHNNYHQTEIKYGNFEVTSCEQKIWPNLAGECPNKEFHPNKKSFDVEYFCTDCFKGICSYCKVYGDEKHPDLQLLTEVFKNCKAREKEKSNFDAIIKNINTDTKSKQEQYKKDGKELKDGLFNKFLDLQKILDGKFTEEGEKIICICYQLNLLKDNLIFYHKAYLNKEKLCKENNMKQELFWTKKTHLDNLLYLIKLKDNIKTKYLTDQNEFYRIIKDKENEIDKEINEKFGFNKNSQIIMEKENDNEQDLLTYETFIKVTQVDKNN